MDTITNLINDYGIIAIFIIILLEYACFPISSEIVLPFSGAMASHQNIPYLLLVSLSVAAGLMGTTVCYLIGKRSKNILTSGPVKRFPGISAGLNASTEKFHKLGKYAVCICRIIPICRTYIAFIAGAAGQSFITFIFSSLLGITLWNTVLIGIGYFLRENWGLAGLYYQKYKQLLVPMLLVILLIFLYLRSVRRVKKELKK